MEKLLLYIVEEPSMDADKKHILKWDICLYFEWLLNVSTSYIFCWVSSLLQVSFYCKWDIHLWGRYNFEIFSWGCRGEVLPLIAFLLFLITLLSLFIFIIASIGLFCPTLQLMDLLFSFIKPDHVHNTLLAGYFSKVKFNFLFDRVSWHIMT